MIECIFCDGLLTDAEDLIDHCVEHHARAAVESILRARLLTIRCDTCGESKERAFSKINDRQHCDRECYDSRGEKKPGVTYREHQRDKALERDGHECVSCGSSDNLDVHHLDPIEPVEKWESIYDMHALDNLETLCRSCHIRREPRNTI